ncbi:hypothetical protein [Rhizobium halophilum]|uniref:hypothetical protein n=1 Tax=Rhizobium halophilum TaxID=2846852 RepID=UPI001EFEC7D6|nr:hypothetical protein [Rhizobium halophilum]MCF6369554.1 hypothetical protein [Rhizobium halophilum]
MTASIARYLKDFGEPTPLPLVLADDKGDPGFGESFPSLEAIEVPVDLEEERAEARAEGYDAGLTEARRIWAEEKEAVLKAHADEISAIREKYEVEIASLVERKLGEAAVLIAEAVSNQTAQVLAPVVEDALVSKAVDDLADLLRTAIIEGDAGAVIIRGPASLFRKLSSSLSQEHATVLRHVEAVDLDITAEFGDAALVTRLSAWSARLKEVLA